MKHHAQPQPNEADKRLIHILQFELAETNRGLIALSMELEQRVEERTAELRITQDELQRTNTDLLLLTMELEDRVDERTKELTQAITNLHQEIIEREKVEAELKTYRDHLEEIIKERTAEVESARKIAEAASQSKSSFLANMSHELRTPMNAILGFSGLMMQDDALSEKQREYLDIISRSGKHLLALINDVLDMSKIEAGQITLDKQAFDLLAMIQDITNMMRVRIVEKGLQFLMDQPVDLPRHIFGDEAKLRQILLNLLSNACKFTPRGGITLRIGILAKRECSKLLIEVEDTGIGISAENQSRIFEAFYQVGMAATERGTGLGLAISRQFVELMGGSIHVESISGQGSTFRLELPLETAEGVVTPYLYIEDSGDAILLEPGQTSKRILIVEDQRENALLLQTLMEKAGFEVRMADNGAMGVEMFQQFKPHLIWMDRRMPVMDGIEATRNIRSMEGGQEVKIVAVTASVFKEQRGELLSAGMDDIINKPFRAGELFDCMEEQLGIHFIRQVTDTPPPLAVISAEALAKLPDELQVKLWDALLDLNTARIDEIVGKINDHVPELGGILHNLAKSYQYTTMIQALEEAFALRGNP
jgi:signal transduction histidine kinase/CheY-like chemotaxis protein